VLLQRGRRPHAIDFWRGGSPICAAPCSRSDPQNRPGIAFLRPSSHQGACAALGGDLLGMDFRRGSGGVKRAGTFSEALPGALEECLEVVPGPGSVTRVATASAIYGQSVTCQCRL